MKLSLKNTFYWSLGGHVVLFLLVLVGSLITSCSKSRIPKEVHVFRLQAGPPAPKVSVSTPVTEPKQTPTRKPETPAPTKPTPKPQKKPIKPDPKPAEKAERNPVSYDEFLKNNQLPEPQKPTPTPPVEQPAQPKQNSNQKLREELKDMIHGFGGTSPDNDQLKAFEQYIAQLRAQLNRLWLQPDNLPSGEWTALIDFTVERNGRVVQVRFSKESGNYDFDQSVIRAMNAFKTTSPPPEGKAQSFTIPFTMTVR